MPNKRNILFVLLMCLYWEGIAQSFEDVVALCAQSKQQVLDTNYFHSKTQAHYQDTDITFYGIDLTAETDDTFLQGAVEIRGKRLDLTQDTLFLDMHHQLQVDSICIANQSLVFGLSQCQGEGI